MKRYVVILTFVLGCLPAFSQEKKYWYDQNFTSYKNYFECEYGVVCNQPAGFKDLDKYFIMGKIAASPDKHAGVFLGAVFKSKDCVVMYPALLLDEKDPITIVNHELRTALGFRYHHNSPLNDDTTTVHYEEYLTTISGRTAREMANADSIYIYHIPHSDSIVIFDDYLKKLHQRRYRNGIGIVLCKEGYYSYPIKLFLTDKGLERKEEYVRMLRGCIWYKDDFEVLSTRSL